MALLAPFAALASEMPRLPAWGLAVAAFARGAWLLRRMAQGSPRELHWPTGDAAVVVDGEAVEDARLHWRGPLAFVSWRARGGRRRERLVFWPDTLPSVRRRELKLAGHARDAALARASMAP